ncbi:MAG: hypothetical protein P4L31_05490 [Candidatus Babeliales bacterium]|nr:hypothetical protein [Candidatus Babeliales bacterium]
MMCDVFNFFQSSSNTIFWTSAIVGTTLFGLRVLAALLGGALDVDDAHVDSVEIDDIHDHIVPSFKLLTLHSISGFFMMFGWAGLACVHQLGFSYAMSYVIACAVGLAVMIITALLFKGALLFQDPGSVFAIQKTVGLIGTVYQRIPAHGQGKIQIVLNGTTREILAQSHDNKTIDSFSIVKVLRVVDYDVVEVTTQI